MARHQKKIAIALELMHKYPWHQQIYAGVLSYANLKSDWTCVIEEFPQLGLNHADGKKERFDGIIARANTNLLRYVKQHQIPLINVWHSSPVSGSCSGVFTDHCKAGSLCAEHLLDRGFRRFGLVGIFSPQSTRDERRGFLDRIAEEGDFFYDCLDYRDFAYSSARDVLRARRVMNEWLDQFKPPFAIQCEVVHIARQLIHLCQFRGWAVPEDVAVVCGENDPLVCESPAPSISAVNYGWDRIGYNAARMLDEMLCGKLTEPVKRYLPPLGIVTRGSSDFWIVEDEIVQKALRYISNRLSDYLRVGEIAHAAQTSIRSLQRKFNRELGRSVSEEICRLRISFAMRLLTQEDCSIKEVARLSGFGSSKRMSEVFRRELGRSPSEYRESAWFPEER